MPETVGCGVVIEVNSVSALAAGATANVTKTNTHARRKRLMCARNQPPLTSHGRIADVAGQVRVRSPGPAAPRAGSWPGPTAAGKGGGEAGVGFVDLARRDAGVGDFPSSGVGF